MPLITGKDTGGIVTPIVTADPVVPVNTLNVTSPGYKNIAIDTRWTPINTIVSHIEGSQWTIDYYSQVITTDSQLAGLQPSSNGTNQQYSKVEKLVVRVSSPLAQSQDPDTKTMTYSGSAHIYSGIIPNEGDMFAASIDNGVTAIFRVTGSTKKSIFRETAYEINYQIETDDPTYLAALEAKVVKTYVYRQDFLTNGQNPIIIKSDDNILAQLMGAYRTLCSQYFPRFYNSKYCTLTIPGQDSSIYDPYLVNFIMKTFETRDHYLVQEIRQLNVDDQPVYKATNIWDALGYRDFSYISTGFTKVGYIVTGEFARNPYFNSIRFTGIDYCVYPLDLDANVNPTFSPFVQPLALQPTVGTSTQFGIPPNLAAVASGVIPNIYPVTTDDRYVLSAEFYNQTLQQSALESAVSSYLKGETIDLMSLYNSAKLFNQWGLLEQYYYVPIVLFLIRAAVRTYQG